MPTHKTHKEQNTVIVSVNLKLDDDARFESIQKQVGQGWRVLTAIPLSGGELGPGGESETFERMLVHLEREIDEENVIVRGAGSARSGAAAARRAPDAARQLPGERTPDAVLTPRRAFDRGQGDSTAGSGDASSDV